MADHAVSRRVSPRLPSELHPAKAVSYDTPLPLGAQSSLAERVRSEFLEMRGFSPTFEQARRLFHLPADACLAILDALITDGFLQCGGDGRYRLAERR